MLCLVGWELRLVRYGWGLEAIEECTTMPNQLAPRTPLPQHQRRSPPPHLYGSDAQAPYVSLVAVALLTALYHLWRHPVGGAHKRATPEHKEGGRGRGTHTQVWTRRGTVCCVRQGWVKQVLGNAVCQCRPHTV